MRPLHLFATLAFCTMLLALPLLSPAGAQAAASSKSWSARGYGTENDNSSLTGSVSVLPYIKNIVYGSMMTFSCWIMPIFGPDMCSNDGKLFSDMMQQSVLANVNGYILAMYQNPPADTGLFVADLGQTLGFMPKTYAQGVGFSGLSALLPLWKVFRNIAYLLIALIMIVVGFMVMLRKKIDPKTVVSVQNALPKIVVTLLLITFSYAIVGIMIDLMYVAMLLAVTVFKSSGLLPDPKWALQVFGYKTPEALYVQGGLLENFINIDVSPWQLFGLNLSGWKAALANLGAMTVGTLLAAGGFLLAGGPIGAIPGGILAFGMPLMYLLISLAMLFLFIRLFVFFASTYIQIIIAMLFGPIQILFDAIPGSNSFSSWFKNLVSNVIVFPIATIIFMLSAIFAKFANEGGNLWSPPFSPLFSSVTAISAVISLGLLFAIPTIAGQIKEMLKAKPFIQAGPEGIAGAVSHPTMLAWQIGQFFVSHRQMGEIAKAVKAKPPSGGGEAE